MLIFNNYKIVNIKRFKIFLVISIFLISLIVFMLFSIITVYPENIENYEYIQIKSGDTLWNIASKYNNKVEIRKFTFIIMEKNNLKDCMIYPGDIIKIPIP